MIGIEESGEIPPYSKDERSETIRKHQEFISNLATLLNRFPPEKITVIETYFGSLLTQDLIDATTAAHSLKDMHNDTVSETTSEIGRDLELTEMLEISKSAARRAGLFNS